MQTRESFPEGWMPMSMFPPESCETYEVQLADDAVHRAFWSGKAWWLQGKAVAPLAWRMAVAIAA